MADSPEAAATGPTCWSPCSTMPRPWPGRWDLGIRWIHILGAGADGFPFEAVGDRVLTCSRGAGGAGHRRVRPRRHARLREAAPPVVDHRPGGPLEHSPARWARGAHPRDRRARGHRHRGGPAGPGLRHGRGRLSGGRRRPPLEGVSLCPDLPTLLGRSDHLVVAAPATPATHHLLDDAAFAALKPGVHLVNVARGSLIDQDALLRALDDGRVAMASLDVVEPEPLPGGHPLYRHPSVRLSPHISWSSPRTVARTMSLLHREPGPLPRGTRPHRASSTRRPATDGTRRHGAVLGHAPPGRALRERLAAAAGAGFAAISLWGRDYAAARAEGLSDADLRSMLDDHGLAVAELDPAWWWLPGAERHPHRPPSRQRGGVRVSARTSCSPWPMPWAPDRSTPWTSSAGRGTSTRPPRPSPGCAAERQSTGWWCTWNGSRGRRSPTWPPPSRSCRRPRRRTAGSTWTPGTWSAREPRRPIWPPCPAI